MKYNKEIKGFIIGFVLIEIITNYKGLKNMIYYTNKSKRNILIKKYYKKK